MNIKPPPKSWEVEYYKFIRDKIKNVLDEMKKIIKKYRLKPLTEEEANFIAEQTAQIIDEAIISEGIHETITKLVAKSKLHSQNILKAIGLKSVLGATITDRDKQVIDLLAKKSGENIVGIADDMKKKIRNALASAVLKGKGMSDIAEEIVQSANINLNRAKVIARTETMTAYNVVAKNEYLNHGITKVQWVTALDERRCPDCASLDEKIFNIEKAPVPPLHPNCRCVLVPVIEGE